MWRPGILIKWWLFPAVLPVASQTTLYLFNKSMLIDANSRKGRGETGASNNAFLHWATSCAILFAVKLLTLPHTILHTSFFYATYGFHIACEYEIKRLGIYNFSCLSRRGAIGLQRGSNDRSTGAEKNHYVLFFLFFFFLFSFIHSYASICIMCVDFFFLRYFTLCVYRFIECLSIMQALSLASK